MRDKDAYLIFESYKKRVVLNEAFQAVGVAAAMILAPLIAILSAQQGYTRDFMNFVKKHFGVDLDAASDTFGGAIVRFLDPSGLSSWITLQKVQEKLVQDPNNPDLNIEYWGQVVGAIPIWNKILKGATALLGGATLVKFLRRVLYYVFKTPAGKGSLQVGIKQFFKNFEKFKAPTQGGANASKLLDFFAFYLVMISGREAYNIFSEIPIPELGIPESTYRTFQKLLNEKISVIGDDVSDEQQIKNDVKIENSEGSNSKPKTQPTPQPKTTADF